MVLVVHHNLFALRLPIETSRYTDHVNNELPGDESRLDRENTAENHVDAPSLAAAPIATPSVVTEVAEPAEAPAPSAFAAPPLDANANASALAAPALSEDELRYQQMSDWMRMPKPPAKPNGSTLLVLGVLSLMWIANTHDSVGSAAALLIALALNQAGHSFAMRGFGYRDRSMLFIPFYGSIATGTKEDATPTQRAIVQLMGPLPGIVLGTVLSFTAARAVAAGHFLHTLVPVLLLLNLFQLLPLPSFTGGELLRLLVLRRNRWVDFAFRAIVGALLVYASLNWGLYVIAIFTVMSLIRLPSDWRIRVAADSIRARFGVLSPLANEVSEEVMRAIYDHAEVLSAKGPAVQRDARRITIAREILRLASEQSPSAGISSAIVGATGAIFTIGAVAFMLFSLWQRGA